uniref:Uncharacterized protein n=1 Tax=Candidatus Kentrum eta TaxID=2126337 RepID=A0A450UDE8_9GAMM|nr:MAG: hypothetical protein BECKH772A_GA0070896_100227 [Candidatus Kentron sp. H]VFJ91678.1 MAG: hypothetical protein BECKH772B_GA0070898_100207 [Candidatus Kentron sp. H]VFJ98285.1 MAG: hypothetical protein BECKH772C_GA0070978_100207 [Candidatus Kentron sp. H]
MAAVLIGLVSTSSLAQQSARPDAMSSEHLNVLNEKIGQLLDQMNERAKTYPQMIEELHQRSDAIEKTGEEVQKMLDDLKRMTDQMDVNSDYHAELNAFEKHTSNLIASVKAKGDPVFEKIAARLKNDLNELQSIDRRRAAAVIQARNIMRALEDHQENLVLIRQIGHIEAAIEIFKNSLGEFENIVSIAQEIQEKVVGAISTP